MAYVIAGTQLDITYSPDSSPGPPSSHGAPGWAEPPRSPEPPSIPEPDLPHSNATDIVIGRLRPVFNWDYSQPVLGDASLWYRPLSPPASHHWGTHEARADGDIRYLFIILFR